MDANPIVLDDAAGDVVVIVVEGEHDIYTAPTLRERLDEALGRGGGVVVDLTAATFVDSSILGALLDARPPRAGAARGSWSASAPRWSPASSASSTSRASFPCCP
jgi:anti-sigma B factor antagonist